MGSEMCIRDSLQHMTFELVNATKQSLRELKLTSYAAENVSNLVRDITSSYQLIKMFGHIDAELIVAIGRSFETGTDPRFRHFAMNKTPEWKTLAKTLRYKQQSAIISYDDFQRGSQLDLHGRLMEYVDEHNGLLHSKTYEPAAKSAKLRNPRATLTKTEDETNPTAKKLTQQSLKDTQEETTPKKGDRNRTTPPTNDDDYRKNRATYCMNCGKTKVNCKKIQETKGTTPNCARGTDWKQNKKADEIKVGVFQWYWCGECKAYATHKPKNHDKAMERKKQAQTRRKKGPTAKTLKPDGSSDDEPLSLGFLRSGNLF